MTFHLAHIIKCLRSAFVIMMDLVIPHATQVVTWTAEVCLQRIVPRHHAAVFCLAQMGVTNVSFSGRVRTSLTAISDRIPVVGSLQVCLNAQVLPCIH